MTPGDDSPGAANALRLRAQAVLREATLGSRQRPEAMTDEALREALHELRVHQIELEMQNEELREAQEQLQISRSRYFDLYDLAPVGYCTLSGQGAILQANLSAATLLGLPRTALANRRISSIILREDQAIFDRVLARLRGGDDLQSCELRLLRGDGTQCWVQLAATRAREDDCVLLTLTDTTARVRAETDMRLRSAALNAAANAIVITDSRGAVEWSNPAFTTLSGYDGEEVRSQTLAQLITSDRQDPAVYSNLWDTLFRGEAWQGEISNRRKDGGLYTEEITITPLKDEHGEITHFIAVIQDVTRRKLLEEQFRHAQKLESVGRLAGGVAHDFNNLLTVINGTAELAHQQLEPGDPLAREMEQVLWAGERAATLTRQLLAFSRRQVLRPEILSPTRVVTNIMKMLVRLVGEDVVVETRFEDDTALVLADVGQLEQVIANLVVNARDAMPLGGRLSIATGNVELGEEAARSAELAPGAYVQLRVSDTGHGMDEATLARIFEPFFTTKAVGKGTGLGLATVHGIVRQSGGGIAVRSEPDRGTDITLYLPPAPPRAAAASTPPEASPNQAHETVLLLDDDDAVRSVTARMLAQAGYKVITAGSAEEAILAMERQAGAIGLLLTDVVMPDLSGPELARQLQARYPALKVLFITGCADDLLTGHGEGVDPARVLGKPFQGDMLVRKVRESLRG